MHNPDEFLDLLKESFLNGKKLEEIMTNSKEEQQITASKQILREYYYNQIELINKLEQTLKSYKKMINIQIEILKNILLKKIKEKMETLKTILYND